MRTDPRSRNERPEKYTGPCRQTNRSGARRIGASQSSLVDRTRKGDAESYGCRLRRRRRRDATRAASSRLLHRRSQRRASCTRTATRATGRGQGARPATRARATPGKWARRSARPHGERARGLSAARQAADAPAATRTHARRGTEEGRGMQMVGRGWRACGAPARATWRHVRDGGWRP
ncbi:hypothetical protein PAHAL_5G181300 [Panicum hallii]|jgi:hypothetical protein|uniref:Uncharacterized protein n=1 Tax=Panicum hallii TaxID=206008 RepID=A0A2T8IKB5_9POAL|nr:hypothetical protein PAHAL_5G181300 [Panicum hallii]